MEHKIKVKYCITTSINYNKPNEEKITGYKENITIDYHQAQKWYDEYVVEFNYVVIPGGIFTYMYIGEDITDIINGLEKWNKGSLAKQLNKFVRNEKLKCLLN